MLKQLTVVAVAASILAACAGRGAMPEPVRMPSDDRLSCKHLQNEQFVIDNKLTDLNSEKAARTKSNIGWGVGGLFFFPAWLGLNLGDAPEQEENALKKRSNHLTKLSYDKDC